MNDNMKYKKIIPNILIFLFLCSFTTALLDINESFYEDFTSPSNDLNTSNWIWVETPLTGASYSVSGGEIYMAGGDLSNAGKLILHNLDFNVNAKSNSFSVEMRIKSGSVGVNHNAWLYKNFKIGDSNNTWAGETSYLESRISGLQQLQDYYIVYEKINSTEPVSSQSTFNYTQLLTTYKIYKWIKTDTNLEFILEGVSQYNQTLNSTWNSDNDDMADNMTFFSIYGGQHNYVSMYIDWINVTNLGGDTIPSCTPDWSCSGYGSCNISDLSPCNETIDNNVCNESYTGDYSEFSPQSCNYCSANWQQGDIGDCINETQTIDWTDLNFASCCNVTGLSTDCDNPNPTNQSCSDVFEYVGDDIASAIIDLIVKTIILIALFSTPFIAVYGGNKLHKKIKK